MQQAVSKLLKGNSKYALRVLEREVHFDSPATYTLNWKSSKSIWGKRRKNLEGINMRRVVVVLALLALALPIAAWADGITFANSNGTIAISDMAGTGGLGTIGSTTITSKGSNLTAFTVGMQSWSGHLGSVDFSTGVLLTGSVANGGTFSDTGSTFDIIGKGSWASKLTGEHCGAGCTLFAGSFSSTIDWTQTGSGKPDTYVLSGSLVGTLWNGRQITSGSTQQDIYIYKNQAGSGVGHITGGTGTLSTPEPGTLGLLGTGLVGIAGMFRKKIIG
jgi:PEP-CTERM motif